MPSPYNGTMESKEAETKGQKMGHNINYMTADRNVNKNRVIAEIDYGFRAGKPMVLAMG